VLVIIQARMSSKRFRGKVLHKINNKPLIWYLINNIKKSKKVTDIIVATSKNKSDDVLTKYLKKINIKFFRGNLNNVMKRLFDLSKKLKKKYFLRISADSPLIDYRIIDKAILLANKKKKFDLITNVFPRSYPSGQSTEIIRSEILGNALNNPKITKYDLEHVTTFFYKNNKKYKIINFSTKKKYYNKFSIDYKNDLGSLEKYFKA
jgi:spore coat polysaccharide biosynthesis protein SpsF